MVDSQTPREVSHIPSGIRRANAQHHFGKFQEGLQRRRRTASPNILAVCPSTGIFPSTVLGVEFLSDYSDRRTRQSATRTASPTRERRQRRLIHQRRWLTRPSSAGTTCSKLYLRGRQLPRVRPRLPRLMSLRLPVRAAAVTGCGGVFLP